MRLLSVAEKRKDQISPIISLLRSPLVPLLAIFTALVVASVVLIISGINPIRAYLALADGAFGSWDDVITTLIKATPYIFAGLGFALCFRGGLFNIGIEGQISVGSIMAVIVGTSLHLPAIIQIPLTLLAGIMGGGIWAGISGYLKARTGASEVITTIMTNFVALRVITWLIGANGPLRAKGMVPETNPVDLASRLPLLIPGTILHSGVLLALITAVIVYWLLFHTVTGFEIRIVGANPEAARYIGINIGRHMVRTMFLSGALAGLAGAVQVMGLPPYTFTIGFNVGYGFDSIAVAVLGGLQPLGVIFSALLFGAMNAGAHTMQLRTRVPIDIVSILQGLILMFVGANQIVRKIYHIQDKSVENIKIPAQASDGEKI
jgi:simple sugar transport system permease protein